MAPRPPNPEAKENLLDVGQELVLRQGFAATSIDQICAQAGTTKGSFFHYFSSKQALGEELLRRYGAERMAFMAQGPEREIEDPRDRLFAYLERMLGVSETGEWLDGCLMGNLGQELSRSNPGLREIIAAGMQVWAEFVAADLREAKRRYAPRADWRPEDVARHLIAVFQGGLLLSRIAEDRQLLRASLEQYVRYLESLLGKPGRATARRRKEKS